MHLKFIEVHLSPFFAIKIDGNALRCTYMPVSELACSIAFMIHASLRFAVRLPLWLRQIFFIKN